MSPRSSRGSRTRTPPRRRARATGRTRRMAAVLARSVLTRHTDQRQSDTGYPVPGVPMPDPNDGPEAALHRQLTALADNDDPVADAGVKTAYRGSSERAHLFRGGVNRVRLVMQPQDLGRSGSYSAVTQSPKPTWKHWGPSRRHAPHGGHSTSAPATRDGVTVRPIQPRRRASLSAVTERTGRPMARPVRLTWDDHTWSEAPSSHESPNEQRTDPSTVYRDGNVAPGES